MQDTMSKGVECRHWCIYSGLKLAGAIEGKKDTMFIFILLLGIGQNHAVSLIQHFEGSVDEQGVCQCSVVLPDSTFPADRLETLEIYNRNLSITAQQQITKIHHYESTLIIYMERLFNLTKRVEVMEIGGLSYTKLDFELVKLEIREMEALILQLKSSMNGTNVLVEALYVEIRNFSILVNQLEVYDKNNVLVIRREIAALQKRLEECEKNQTRPALPPGNYGTCEHGSITNISKPFVVQLNYLGSGYIDGGWGADSLVGSNQDIHWVAPLSGTRTMNRLGIYNKYNDLLIYQQNIDRSITSTSEQGQGGGMIMFNSRMYYNCYNYGYICKYNPYTAKLELSVHLPNAAYNNRFSYSSSLYQDIDMAGDEEGLWAIYSTEANAGNIVISKIDPISLVVKQTWTTAQYKPAVTNAFMVCGVLYVTRAISTRREEIFYMYNTKTEKEGWLSIPLEKPKEKVHSLSYNPNNHKLYMYNNGYLVNYDLFFAPPQKDKAQI